MRLLMRLFPVLFSLRSRDSCEFLFANLYSQSSTLSQMEAQNSKTRRLLGRLNELLLLFARMEWL